MLPHVLDFFLKEANLKLHASKSFWKIYPLKILYIRTCIYHVASYCLFVCLFVVSLLLNILVLMKDIHRSKSLEVISITKIFFHNRHVVTPTLHFENVWLALLL